MKNKNISSQELVHKCYIMAAFLSGSCRRKSISLPFPHSKAFLHYRYHHHLQSQQWLVESLSDHIIQILTLLPHFLTYPNPTITLDPPE